MKAKLVLLLIMSIYGLVCMAQDIEVKKFGPMEKDQTAALNPRKDINGMVCGLVKVLLKEPRAEFDGNVMGDVQFTGSEYLVYLPNGTKRLGIKHPDYLPTTIVFADYGVKKIASATTYELKVKTNKKKAKVDNSKKGMAVFNIKPSNAMLLIDGQIADGSGGAYTLSLPHGTHYYTVKLKDFSINNQSVQIDKNAKNINVDLTEFFAKIDVSCKTEDAEILINNEQKGVGKWGGMIIPGKYTIEVKKDGCHSQSRQVELKDNDVVTVDFSALKTITGSLRVDYEPAGADVLLNGKKVGVTPLEIKELPVGDYNLEIWKEYYVKKFANVKIREDQEWVENGTLELTQFGNLMYASKHLTPEIMIDDYYRIGYARYIRGNPFACERDTFKVPLNPLKSVELLKKIVNNKKNYDADIADYAIERLGMDYHKNNAEKSFDMAKLVMEKWEDYGIPYINDNYRFGPMAWHYYHGVGCQKDLEKAKELMKSVVYEFQSNPLETKITKKDLPHYIRIEKDKEGNNIVIVDNAYESPAYYDLVKNLKLDKELHYVPDVIKEYLPELFGELYPDPENW